VVLLGEGLKGPHHIKYVITKYYTGTPNWTEGPVAVSCEHGNERSGSIKSGEFLD